MNTTPTRKILKFEGESGYSFEEQKLPPDQKRRSFYFVFGRVSELGFVIAIPIVGGVFLGRWLDGKFDTNPMLTVIGVVLGVMVSFGAMYNIIKDFS